MQNDVTVLLIVGKTDDMETAIIEAARLAFPLAAVKSFHTLQEALQTSPEPVRELLVLVRPAEDEVARAIEAKDGSQLPRWPVVVLGSAIPADEMEIVPPREWQAPLLARAFQSAAARFFLRRENRRMRGDLRTVAHRVGHDLRAPLSAILFTAHALKSTSADDAHLIESLIESTEEIEALFERIIFVLKASTNGSPKAPIDMESIVSNVLHSLENRISATAAQITRPDAWPQVPGVDAWIEVIWRNLLNNALRHGGEQPRIELGWDETERSLRFWIRDQDGGVAPERRGELFRPFHALHDGTGSRGLGLSIVQRLVDLQGGYCGYEPVPEGGSCFFFALPKGELSKNSEDQTRKNSD